MISNKDSVYACVFFLYCSNFMATTFISLTAMSWRRISALERIRSANVVSTESPVWSMLSKYVWNLLFESTRFHQMLSVWQNTVLCSKQQRYWRFHTSFLMNCRRGPHHSVSVEALLDTVVTSPLHFRLLTEPRRTRLKRSRFFCDTASTQTSLLWKMWVTL